MEEIIPNSIVIFDMGHNIAKKCEESKRIEFD